MKNIKSEKDQNQLVVNYKCSSTNLEKILFFYQKLKNRTMKNKTIMNNRLSMTYIDNLLNFMTIFTL